jgi:hypothetical protein
MVRPKHRVLTQEQLILLLESYDRTKSGLVWEHNAKEHDTWLVEVTLVNNARKLGIVIDRDHYDDFLTFSMFENSVSPIRPSSRQNG